MLKLENISKSEFQKTQPRPNRGRPNEYPFDKMDVGQSFFVQGDVQRVHNIRGYASRYSHSGKKFSVAKTEDGCRVFRVK